ncbi:cytochrome P450 2J2-like isoform X1 [Pantherophis guttatus]|uniref:Cytochrome P450 2J2-like isoform X1 n=1 Tax=Pantherophis guttatus TaxID=94885 RepID=A0A6P9B219_PANGU|nr:cytochrome P450 2J2-like isoform X1 [Pantherophis guttatus]
MAEIWEVLTTVLVGFLILDFLKLLWSSRRYPPGPLPLPLIGGLWRIGTKLSNDTFSKMSKQYGNIYTMWVWHQPVVVISGFHAMKESLIHRSQDFADRPLSTFLLKICKGKGIAFSNGHAWKEQRHFTISALRLLGLGKKDMEHKLEEAAHQLVEIFARTKGQPIDPLPAIINSVCNMICLLSLGYRFPPEDGKFQMIIEDISNYMKFGGSPLLLFYELFPWLVKHLPGPHQKIQASIQTGMSIVKEESEKHSQDLALRQPKDFLDLYLLQIEKKQSDPNSNFDHENMAHCIMEFFVAGTETTGSFLQWALLLMVTYPDIQDKVYKEMETVLGSSDSICYEDRWKLPYTQAVLHEILRSKYVLLFGVPRKTVKNVNVCGLSIPKETLIIADFHSVLLDPKQWESPEEFNPDHFLDKEGNFMKREEFLPYGAGARVCVGENLARIEAFLLFTNLLRSFKWQLPEGVKELNQEPLVGITLHPQPFKLCAVPRCRSS